MCNRADGTWLLPLYRSLETGGAFGHDHSAVLLLDREGRPGGAPIPVPESTGRVHGSLVPTERPGEWLQFFRSRLADRIYRSRSFDEGLSWSVPEPTDLPNNNSSIQAVRLASGRLAMIFNRYALPEAQRADQVWGEANWPRRRWPLAIALSEDDGDSWPWIRDIDTGWGFCGSANGHRNGQLAYPTLLEGAPGDLHLAYSWAGRQAIRYLCVREEEILGVLPARPGA
jgi:predicted neuraminidase